MRRSLCNDETWLVQAMMLSPKSRLAMRVSLATNDRVTEIHRNGPLSLLLLLPPLMPLFATRIAFLEGFHWNRTNLMTVFGHNVMSTVVAIEICISPPPPPLLLLLLLDRPTGNAVGTIWRALGWAMRKPIACG
jgi:hypothetical protein